MGLSDTLPLLGKVMSLAKALLTGDNVSEEQLQRRIEVCAACDRVQRSVGPDGSEQLACGICGCRLAGDKSLVNLARFVETDSYGCKHEEGSRWKAAGC